MLRITAIILVFLSLHHFCVPYHTGEHHYLRKVRFVKVDAAMGIHTDQATFVYLFIGEKVQVLKNRKFFEEKPRKAFHLPDNMHLQAAFVTVDSDDKRIYYGDAFGQFVSVLDDVKKRQLKYGPARAFIRDGGPDAAARRSGDVYVFKGCQVAVRKNWDNWGTPVNVTTIGLPCDVDAAWNENFEMVILKGDQIWLWNPVGQVRGPEYFGSLYTLKPGYVLLRNKEEKATTQAVMDYKYFDEFVTE